MQNLLNAKLIDFRKLTVYNSSKYKPLMEALS